MNDKQNNSKPEAPTPGKISWKPGNMLYPPSGGDGQLRAGGRDAQYYYRGLGGHGVFGSGHGLHFRAQGAVFPQDHQGYGGVCDQPGKPPSGAGDGLLRRKVRPGCG